MSDLFNLYAEAGSPNGDDQPQSAIRWAADEIARLQSEVERLRGREVDLLTICQAVQRDLLLRAEPDWDGSGRKVVNLSAGFWDELNRVIGKYDDAACKSFDAAILIKQAEAVEACGPKMLAEEDPGAYMWDLSDVNEWLQEEAQRLRQQAAESESQLGGGINGQDTDS